MLRTQRMKTRLHVTPSLTGRDSFQWVNLPIGFCDHRGETQMNRFNMLTNMSPLCPHSWLSIDQRAASRDAHGVSRVNRDCICPYPFTAFHGQDGLCSALQRVSNRLPYSPIRLQHKRVHTVISRVEPFRERRRKVLAQDGHDE